jgi:hypothetical protein
VVTARRRATTPAAPGAVSNETAATRRVSLVTETNAAASVARSPRTEYRVACRATAVHMLSPTPNEARAAANVHALDHTSGETCGPHRVEVRTVYTTPWQPQEADHG